MSRVQCRHPARALVVACAALSFLSAHTAHAGMPPAPDSVRVPAGIGVPSAPTSRIEGVPLVGVNELARLLGATKYWRPDVRRLVLRAGEHRLTFTDDNPFVLVDDRTVRLSQNVTHRAGELQIPVEIVRLLPEHESWPRLAYDADARQVRVAPSAGFVGAPRVEVRGSTTLVVIPTERADAAAVLGRSRARFRLRVAGGLTGTLPDSLPEDALVRALRVSAAPGGLTFELAVDRSATGWRLERDPDAGRITLTFARGTNGLEAFAMEGARGPRVLKTIVIDPGHGGTDTGVRVEGAEESALALALARLVADELQRRAGIHVVLTRSDDSNLEQDGRAEIANRARADAVLSLHFESLQNPNARGSVAWCAPASLTPTGGASVHSAGLVTLLPWHDVALERAVESRGLAESITSMLERHGFGPVAVRERMPLALVGVQSPGILLDCGTLSNPDERVRLLSADGLRALASAVCDGVLAWQRNE